MAIRNDNPITVNMVFKSGTAVVICTDVAAADAMLATIANSPHDILYLGKLGLQDTVVINRSQLEYAFIRGDNR
jgi:hypothetical protein